MPGPRSMDMRPGTRRARRIASLQRESRQRGNHVTTFSRNGVNTRKEARQHNFCVRLRIGDPAQYAAIRFLSRRR